MVIGDEFAARFAAAREQKDRYEKLSRLQAAQEQECVGLRSQVDALARQLRAEEADVEQLERPSLKSVVLGLLGNRDAALDKERQEAELARFKYDQVAQRLARAEADRDETRRALKALGYAAEHYEFLLEEKERHIQQAGGRLAGQLSEAMEREARAKTQVRELDEAIHAGRDAESALQAIEESLGSAKSWGTWDLLGGGMIATAIKHSRLDDAESSARSAQYALDRFARELKDVQVDLRVQGPDVGGFLTFADYFFDGLIADLTVQSRINEALDGVRRTSYEVSALLRALCERHQQALQEVAAAGAAYRSLVEEA